jgi:acyl-CoA synthetase (NDP forming)
MNHRLAPLLAPRSIAIVGASPKVGTVQRNIVDVVRQSGFAGNVVAVNPNYKEVESLPCFPNIAAMPAPPDLAVLGVGAARMETALDDAIKGGARAITIFDNCYLEVETSPKLLDRLKTRARASGVPVCGGNGMGFYNFENSTYVSHYHPPKRPAGHIAFIAHSGSAFDALVFNDPRYRFNLAVSPGQEINASIADYMDYALDLASTRVIALFIETVRDPDGFVSALIKARERDVPVIAVKVGRTEQSARLAQTHTDALVGNDAAFDAVLARYGALRVRTLDELISAALILAMPKRAPEGGLAVMIDSGGFREALIDLASDIGVPLTTLGPEATELLRATLPPYLPPVNPLDIGVPLKVDRPPMVKKIWQAFLADPGTAIGAFEFEVFDDFCYSPGLIDAAEEIAASAMKPFFVFSTFGRANNAKIGARYADSGLPLISGVDNMLAAVRAGLSYRDLRNRVPAALPPKPADDVTARWRMRLRSGRPLDEHEGLSLLSDFGVPVVPSRVAESQEDACEAAGALGFPVALKTAARGIQHKSDIDGVRLGLQDVDAVVAAYKFLSQRLGPRMTVARMADRGVELAFGIMIDPQFGPLVIVGMGGTLIEVLSDRTVALAPFDAIEARRLIDCLKGRPLLDGVRGALPADINAAAHALAQLSVLAATLGSDLRSVDVNPVIVGAAACVAVDALVIATDANP